MTVGGFVTSEVTSPNCATHTTSKHIIMPPAFCHYCMKTLSSQQNYTKHLRYFASKPEETRKNHPAANSDEFGVLEQTLKMWTKPPVLADQVAQDKARSERKAANNARYYNKKRLQNQDKVKAEINRAL
jgi:hypothetical protein